MQSFDPRVCDPHLLPQFLLLPNCRLFPYDCVISAQHILSSHTHTHRPDTADLLLSTSLTFIIILLFFSLQTQPGPLLKQFPASRSGKKKEYPPTREISSSISSVAPAVQQEQVSLSLLMPIPARDSAPDPLPLESSHARPGISRLVGDQVRGSSGSSSRIGNPDIGRAARKLLQDLCSRKKQSVTQKRKEAEERQLLLFVSLSPPVCLSVTLCVLVVEEPLKHAVICSMSLLQQRQEMRV